MKIREILEKDILDCLKLLKQLTVVDENFDYISVFNQISTNPNHYIYVVEKDGKIVGMATVLVEQKFIHSGSRVGHIEDVVVDSKYRGLNIGKKLVEKCVETAKERNCYKVILDCSEDYIPFYTKCGFKEFATSMKIINLE